MPTADHTSTSVFEILRPLSRWRDLRLGQPKESLQAVTASAGSPFNLSLVLELLRAQGGDHFVFCLVIEIVNIIGATWPRSFLKHAVLNPLLQRYCNPRLTHRRQHLSGVSDEAFYHVIIIIIMH